MNAKRHEPLAARMVAVIASLAGIASLLAMRQLVGDSRTVFYVVMAMPFAVGMVAVMWTMETRMRVVLLWLAALMSGWVAIITIMSGAGLVILGVMAAYLAVAWMMNEAGEPLPGGLVRIRMTRRNRSQKRLRLRNDDGIA